MAASSPCCHRVPPTSAAATAPATAAAPTTTRQRDRALNPAEKTVPQTQARTTPVVASMHRRRRATGDDDQSTNTNAADRMKDQDYTAVPTGEAGDDGVPSSFYGSKKGYRAWFPRSYNFRRRVSVGLIVAVFVVAGLLASLGLGASRGHIQGEDCQRQTTNNQWPPLVCQSVCVSVLVIFVPPFGARENWPQSHSIMARFVPLPLRCPIHRLPHPL